MDDERKEELDCIAAIFPEIDFDPQDPYTAFIELPVNPQTKVKVVFPSSAEELIPEPQSLANGSVPALGATDNDESHDLSYLPNLEVRISLPDGYPAEKPPQFELSTNPSWLSRKQLDELEATGKEMWEDTGRSVVVFGFIDSLQQAAENAFGFAEEGKILEVSQDMKISLLDYDIKARVKAFEKETFDCGICLDPKKGAVCHRMIDCGHVFCVTCLQDFYNNAITEGDLISVKCLAPDCAKNRAAGSKKRKKPKYQLSPSELLLIPLNYEMVSRYVKLKHKAGLESDKNTVYCPRKWCQGAARSKKHRKPDGLEDTDSGDESDPEDGSKPELFRSGKDLLSICEDCAFAFCNRCYQGWHGELQVCVPQKPTGEMTEEDKASIKYLEEHSTPCPTCAARAQKTHGCNHMICFKCNSHFCYLCSSWLDATNPYKHFNQEHTQCYMRLWELEDGDGDFIDRINGRNALALEEFPAEEDEEEVEGEAHQVPVDVAPEPDNPAPAPLPIIIPEPELAPNPEPVVPVARLQREGPLVLRINQIPRPIAAPAPAPVPAAGPPARRHRNAARRGGVALNGRGRNPNAQQPRVGNGRGDIVRDLPPADQDAAQQAWVQRFVQMALNDEEDLVEWDSDEDNPRWEIPVR